MKVFLFVLIFVFAQGVQAASLTYVSDTVSDSRPGVSANHTITFTTTNAVPAGGKIVVTPQAGAFTIPAGLDFTDTDFLVGAIDKTLGALPGSGSQSAIGVSAVAGAASNIAFILNSVDSILAGSAITIKIGTNAASGAAGDQQMRNPTSAGSLKIQIATYDSSSALIDQATAMIAVLSPVFVVALKNPLATRDFFFMPTIFTTSTLTNPDTTKLIASMPAGFVSFTDEVHFQVTSFSKEKLVLPAPPPSGKSLVSKVYDISFRRALDSSVISSVEKPVTLDFFYSDDEISGVDESTLLPYRWSGTSWVVISGSTVFPQENRVSVSIQSFSIFTLMSEAQTPAPAPAPAGGGGAGTGTAIPPSPITEKITKTGQVRPGNFNSDGKVDLVDLSILLYNWGAPKNILTDINKDGKVDLVDFSILLYWWTG